MASLVKEAAPDEAKTDGWSRIGIRRKAAAEPAGTASGSAEDLATPEDRDGGPAAPLASITLLSTGRVKRESRGLLEVRRDAEEISGAAGGDEHSFVVTEMVPDVGNRSPRVEVKPGSPRGNVPEQGPFPRSLRGSIPQLAGSSAIGYPAPARAVPASSQEGVGGESTTDCGQSDGIFPRECPSAQSCLPAASLDRSTEAVATAAMAMAAAEAAATVRVAPPAAVGVSPPPAVGIAPPDAAAAAAAAAAATAVGVSPPLVGVSTPAAGLSPPSVGVSMPPVGVYFPAAGLSIPAFGVSRPAVGVAPPDSWAESDIILQGAAAAAAAPMSELLPPAPPQQARRLSSRRKVPPRSRRNKGSNGLLDSSEGRGSDHAARPRTCSFEGGCPRRPSYGCVGDPRATRCASHKTDQQVDITSRRCEREGCTRVPSFRCEGGKGKYSKFCAAHRLPGMEKMRVCEAAIGCTRSPSFGFTGRKRMSCSLHKEVGMTNLNIVRCRGPECRLTPCFALRGSPAAFCAKHKEPGMVNVVSKRCEDASCDRIPSYGWEGGGTRASFCATHKAEGMVNVRHRRCANPECKRQPVWGKAGGKAAVFCKEHKEADMVDVKNNYGQPQKKKAKRA